jgi:hypothetical protein
VHDQQDLRVVPQCPAVGDDPTLEVAQCHRRGRIFFDAVAVASKVALQKGFDRMAFEADELCV